MKVGQQGSLALPNLANQERTNAASLPAAANGLYPQTAIDRAIANFTQIKAGVGGGSPVPLSENLGQAKQGLVEAPKLQFSFDSNFKNWQLQGFWGTSADIVRSINDGSFKKEIQSLIVPNPPATSTDIVPPEPIPQGPSTPALGPGDFGDPAEGAGGADGSGGGGGGDTGEVGADGTEKLC